MPKRMGMSPGKTKRVRGRVHESEIEGDRGIGKWKKAERTTDYVVANARVVTFSMCFIFQSRQHILARA